MENTLDFKELGQYFNTELINMTNIDEYLPQTTIDAVAYQMQKNPKKASNVELSSVIFEAGKDNRGEKIAKLWFDYNSEIIYLETTDHSIRIIDYDKYRSLNHYNEELAFDTKNGAVVYGNMFKLNENANKKPKSTNPDQNQPGSY